MELPFRTKMDHRPADWARDPIYFITICARERGRNKLCGEAAAAILRSIGFYNEQQRWWCNYAVLMPDHVHLLVSFEESVVYQKTVGDWKRWITRQHGIEWQENFFDHRLRNGESAQAKWMYLRQNPVRAGLAAKAENWPWFWEPSA